MSRTSSKRPVTPCFLSPPTLSTTAILREPFTTSLGITICAENMPWAEGTAGFFLAVPGVNKLFLVTARHVLFPRSKNEPFECTDESQARYNVLVLSETSFQRQLISIRGEVDNRDIIVAVQGRRIEGVRGPEDAVSKAIREDAELEVKKAKARAKALTVFYWKLSGRWSTDRSRLLGHVVYSPPIVASTGTNQQQYTQDIAVVEIDSKEIKPNDFPGNFVDLGTKYTPVELTHKMQPNTRNRRNFAYPGNRLFKLRGTISKCESRRCWTGTAPPVSPS